MSGSNVEALCLEELLAKTVFILSIIAALPELALLPIFGRPGVEGDEESELASRLPRDGESGLKWLAWIVSAEGWGASECDLVLPSCPCAFGSACLLSGTGGGEEKDNRADL